MKEKEELIKAKIEEMRELFMEEYTSFIPNKIKEGLVTVLNNAWDAGYVSALKNL